MTPAVPGRRAGEGRLLRGCCAGLAVALILLCACVLILGVRLTASPALGAAPAGPADGASPSAIAALLAGEVSDQLDRSGAPGAVILLSERDLTTLAASANPDPRMFSGIQVRARDGQLWVSAESALGPLSVVVTARLTIRLGESGSITPTIDEIDVGDQAVPGFLRSAVDPDGSAAFSLSPLLTGSALSPYGLECLTVVQGRGLELGFHMPLLDPDPGYCAAHPVAATPTNG